MAKTFLGFISGYLRDHFSRDSEGLCLVFSNRRAKLFYQRELKNTAPGAIWLPEILSMEDFVQQLSGVSFCDPLTMLFEFYEVYREAEKEQAEPFDLFSSWASQLLHDFEETDLYLVDAAALYRHVDDAYALKNWSPDGMNLTRNQEQYIRFWSRMGVWYAALKKRMLDKGIMSQAMAFRLVAEQIGPLADTMPWKQVIFAGFNALNQAEQRFISALEKKGKAVLIWDSDQYYLDNEMNEAGYFMRQFMKKNGLNQLNHTGNYFSSGTKKISITGVAKNTGQAVFAAGILKTLAESEPELSNTALVLCDEQLLIPVLEFLPDEVKGVNVTMGYPLHLLPEAGFFLLAFELQAHKRKSAEKTAWYHRDLIRLFQHPLMNNLLNPSFLNLCRQKIQEGRHVFITLDKLLKITGAEPDQPGILKLILNDWDDKPSQAMVNLSAIAEAIRKALLSSGAGSKNTLQQEALFSINLLINKLKSFTDHYQGLDQVKTLHRFFEQLLRQNTLSFYGEPLDGLQVMGLLETRNLDFKNIILLSVNEGVLPKGRTQHSFIPLDISSAYGLPSFRERDAVFAFHFYRMLQRAENVWLVYNTEPDEFAKGEKSRFIAQLEEELKFSGIQIERNTWVPEITMPEGSVFLIQKSKQILNRIYERFGKDERRFLSPSALNNYIECSLRFYFKYLCGLKTDDELDEEIGADMMGTIVHKVLQDFFDPLKGQIIQPADYDQMLAQLPVKIREVFLEKIAAEDLDQGKNLLIYRGAEQMVANYLKTERRMLETGRHELIILETEHFIGTRLQAGDAGQIIYLGGFADRIDELDGEVRIIDYKTGVVNDKFLKINAPAEILEKEKMGKTLQLLMYKYLARDTYPSKTMRPGIISLRTPSKGLFELIIEKEGMDETEAFFQAMVNDLIDPEKPFQKTEDIKKCKYCDFQTLCNRQE